MTFNGEVTSSAGEQPCRRLTFEKQVYRACLAKFFDTGLGHLTGSLDYENFISMAFRAIVMHNF